MLSVETRRAPMRHKALAEAEFDISLPAIGDTRRLLIICMSDPFDANGVTLGVLHKAVKATYPGIEIAPPPQS